MTSRRERLADRKLIVSSCLEEEISQCQPLSSWPPAHEPVLQVTVTLQKKSSEPKSRCVRVPIVESLRESSHPRLTQTQSVTRIGHHLMQHSLVRHQLGLSIGLPGH